MAAAPTSASARVHSFIVVDAQTGRVLEAHNADARTYPASLAKLMTLYITFQRLSTGKMTLRERLHVSSHAAAQAPTKLFLRPGETISVKSAILGITTKSANDAAVVLAEAIGGKEWKFASLMNQTARRLGMDHTTFRNASGLPNWRQKTTARDMATLALAILHNFPQYYDYFGVNSFVFRGKRIHGYDNLLDRCPGVDGMKTGYTRASGYNIVTSAVRNGRRLLGVVMGGRTARSRDRLMEALLKKSFYLTRARTREADSQKTLGTGPATAEYEKVSDVAGDDDPVPHLDSGWMIQLGGYFRSPRRVRRVLKSALHTAPESLKSANPLVVKLRGGRYLARFSNMSEAMAQGTCQVLRDKRFTCSVMRNPSSE
ncbi:MAG: D-alanyl-D-alanine carboxypeptidase [Acidobacteriota bacterium]